MARRRGKRRSASTQHKRNEAAFQRKLAAKRRLAAALKAKAILINVIRKRDNQRIYEHETLSKQNRSPTNTRRVDRSGTKDTFKGSAYWAKREGSHAARSARPKVAKQRPNYEKTTSSWMTKAQLSALNGKRRKTRNKWGGDPCVERPDSSKAGKRAQEIKRNGSGSGTYQARRWC